MALEKRGLYWAEHCHCFCPPPRKIRTYWKWDSHLWYWITGTSRRCQHEKYGLNSTYTRVVCKRSRKKHILFLFRPSYSFFFSFSSSSPSSSSSLSSSSFPFVRYHLSKAALKRCGFILMTINLGCFPRLLPYNVHISKSNRSLYWYCLLTEGG